MIFDRFRVANLIRYRETVRDASTSIPKRGEESIPVWPYTSFQNEFQSFGADREVIKMRAQLG